MLQRQLQIDIPLNILKCQAKVVTQKPEVLSSLVTQVFGHVRGKILRAATVEFMINGTFTPGSAMTRGEVAQILRNLLTKLGQ